MCSWNLIEAQILLHLLWGDLLKWVALVLSISRGGWLHWAQEELAIEFASKGEHPATAFIVEMHISNVVKGFSFFFALYPSFPSVRASIIFKSVKKVWNVGSSSHPQLNNVILNSSYLTSAHHTPLSSLHQKGVISWAELLYSLFYLGAKAESVWGQLAALGHPVSSKAG